MSISVKHLPVLKILPGTEALQQPRDYAKKLDEELRTVPGKQAAASPDSRSRSGVSSPESYREPEHDHGRKHRRDGRERDERDSKRRRCGLFLSFAALLVEDAKCRGLNDNQVAS